MKKREKDLRSLSAMAIYVLLLLTAGCASIPKEQPPYRAGATLETLTAAVIISVKAPQGSTGGRGYMVYQRPDRFHLVILTPFGTTAIETFSSDDRLTILIPSRGEAYSGTFDELPVDSPLQGWRMIRLMAVDEPLFDPMKRGVVEKSDSAAGGITSYYDGAGLLERKVFSGGEEVFFRNYRSEKGVPFPGAIEFTDSNGSRVKVTFNEPEINGPLHEGALVPDLKGIALLPLSSFKGM